MAVLLEDHVHREAARLWWRAAQTLTFVSASLSELM
jgi:hypothetical protein